MQSNCYILSTSSRCHQGCKIMHVIANWKEQNSVSKTTKILKNPWPEKANESKNEHNCAIIYYTLRYVATMAIVKAKDSTFN